MANSQLVDFTLISPNKNSPRNHKIDKITIHHMAGHITVEECGKIFSRSSRGASSNYGIDSNGRIGLYVDEGDRSWCSSSPDNDHRAITIEVANDGGSPEWHVSDKAIAALIDLCVDICIRNGISKLNYTGNARGNLTEHNYFTATLCPGPYLKSKLPYIAAEVNKRLRTTPAPQKSVDEIATEVIQGKWGNGKERITRLNEAGYDSVVVQKRVDEMLHKTPAKTNDEIAKEVIQGKWGNGRTRTTKLKEAGYNPTEIQKIVDTMLQKEK